jgi:5-carboxymethyl-2-hydroxymuconate isomerase
MPHCILEYTSDIYEKDSILHFFKNLHDLLVDTKEFGLEAIKSRAVKPDRFYMGNGENNHFVALTIWILPGRAKSFKKELSGKIIRLMEQNFKKPENSKGFSLSVKIDEIDNDSYERIYKE